MVKKIESFLLKISDFSQEGHGYGIWYSQDGASHRVEIPFSIPGDEIEISLLNRKRGVYFSQPDKWVHVSQNRVQPLCKHFGYCGGCRWQHVPYEDQLKQKENRIRKFLEPFLHEGVAWHPIIPCLPPWQYRNKMELSFFSDKSGKHFLGLFLYGARGQVFQMEECHLMHPWIIDVVQAISRWWSESGLDAYHTSSDRGSLRTLTLREGVRTGDRMVMLTVSGNPAYALSQKQLQEFVLGLRKAVEPALPEQKLSVFLRIQQITKGKQTQFYEMQLYGPDHIREILYVGLDDNSKNAISFHISPSAFFQPNSRQAEILYSKAIQMVQFSKESTVYDLYCGTGTLGICMAKNVKEVIGIELSPESALDARENAKLNGLSNIIIHTGDVGKVLPILMKEKNIRPHIVTVDPPRAGLEMKALQHLVNLKAPQILYISCNPATQAANLAILIKEGYRLKAVQPIDQFPQTVHVENIVLLTL